MTSRPAVTEARADTLADLFPRGKPIIGTVHLRPLPGAPRYRGEALRSICRQADEDAQRYVEGGVDGLIVENEGDIPFLKPHLIGPETVAALTAATLAVTAVVDVPVGVFCLANAVVPSLAVAKAVDASFIRANQWANAYVATEGVIEGAAAVALRYRSSIKAEQVRVFADVHVKHGSHAIVADRSIEEMTHDVEAFDADVLIATGQRTGDPTHLEEVEQIKRVASRPTLVGSGLNVDNAACLLQLADGAIVGSAMKEDGCGGTPSA